MLQSTQRLINFDMPVGYLSPRFCRALLDPYASHLETIRIRLYRQDSNQISMVSNILATAPQLAVFELVPSWRPYYPEDIFGLFQQPFQCRKLRVLKLSGFCPHGNKLEERVAILLKTDVRNVETFKIRVQEPEGSDVEVQDDEREQSYHIISTTPWTRVNVEHPDPDPQFYENLASHGWTNSKKYTAAKTVAFLNMDKNETRDILAACSTLRGLDLRAARFAISVPSIVERFSQLQTLCIPSVCMNNLDQIIESLTSSSLQTLEVLGLHPSVPTKYMILAWTTFPNLKEIHYARVRMYLQDKEAPSSQKPSVQSVSDLDPEEAIVQEWDPSQAYRPIGTIVDWWDYWADSKDFMKGTLSAYAQHYSSRNTIRPMYMRFVYPIKAFMSKEDGQAYASGTGLWADGRRFLTIEDAKCTVDSHTTFYRAG